MNEVKPITKVRIRHVLDELSFSHREDQDGDFIGILEADKDVPYDVYCVISLETDTILKIWSYPDKDVPAARKGESLVWCNTWNLEKRWPKVFLNEKIAKITGEFNLDLEKGIHDELLKEIIRLALASCWLLYKELAKNNL